MDELIKEILEETRRLADPEQTFNYECYVELVEKRQQLINYDSPGLLSAADKLQVRQLQEWDAAILRKMQLLQDEANEALIRIQNSKKNQTTYSTPASYEGFMFDKKN
jgi:hypothetical protein